MRKKIVAGNWKMNKGPEEALKLTSEIVNMVKDEVRSDVQVVIAPPYLYLASLKKMISESSNVALAAQNCHTESSGAYTGEVSADMIKAIGAEYVILGHSERREYFKESHEELAKKTDIALAKGLTPIFCCGEPLDIREANTHVEYVSRQLTESLFHLSEEDFSKVVIAYEPIWAIGTGRTASAEQAQEMHHALRQHLASKYGSTIADTIPILYGGSCKPSNAAEIFAGADVDGGLIGGASLQSRDFTDIIKAL
jgi:triosephosphate isomerase (TIM)